MELLLESIRIWATGGGGEGGEPAWNQFPKIRLESCEATGNPIYLLNPLSASLVTRLLGRFHQHHYL